MAINTNIARETREQKVEVFEFIAAFQLSSLALTFFLALVDLKASR